MERKGQVFLNGVNRLSLFITTACIAMFICVNVLKRLEPLAVSALLMEKRILQKQYSSRAGREGRNLFSLNRISGFKSGRNMSTRNYHPLMGHRLGIIGGGLAGLSTAYHILEKSPSTDVTIIDRTAPGTGGASAVAGGLLHPLSPKGKLAYKGFEGLASANQLVEAASRFEDNVVLRNSIYRVAMTEAQAVTFRETAAALPELATWIVPDSAIDMGDDKNRWEEKYFSSEKNVLGTLRLSGDCKVVHMRSYLNGLWSYCESIGSGKKSWVTREDVDSINSNEWKELLADFDCVVFAAGSGLFESSLMNQKDFPINLVRGQSIEMTIDDQIPWNAILCGKYVSPLLESGRVLIGATHEFKETPLTPDEVEVELKERSYHFASEIWDNGTIDRVTCGNRVQTSRGPRGRQPMVGKFETNHHHNSWIFTGLSGRGMLYHGIYGELLSNMILGMKDEDSDLKENKDWWRT
mmetsp:Transcript_25333/g.55526  ORF Transcript_25333/g.55526 Transcript_25333/m.55526 type:complete len:467 (+) Transcript_25333:254-1654(+)|eukprot:CAMPEP_0168283574 /NCGR_PEP_ID=MMETSP0141_2-20121125/23023_1 /TAXON_ID=44445 /ORGANISM="Pseudo-nitzschia australis, Strain 10249 10 AB" /LENGTH=466 /DNA_ID=CAMNT_0008227475 /DNA_START=179 /DNA_END=1579 /DNA_ORIENTATION=+